MSLAFESSRVDESRLMRPCMSVFSPKGSNPPDHCRKMTGIRQDLPQFGPKDEESSSCSSSIGRYSSSNGASCSDGEYSGEAEVQSPYKGPLDTMDSLQDSLPIRKGISNFYSGKSKSFTSLSDVVSSKELAKPESPYNRKRKNLLAHNIIGDKSRSYSTRNTGGGISKRPTNFNRTTLALAVAMSSSDSNSSDDHEPKLPPLHPRLKSHSNFSPPEWSFPSRSFSLTDLQGANSPVSPEERYKKFH
ncbi:hypothetical protein AMTRI_Chr04g242900 [Amborella trichopoda]|uniref:Uncharacterized protein n=1 Tax=Amborella trichopoda TaxID=13333 RepID=W1PVE9_AMBTC|nr:uncharacterized protein LOC18439452 [Amborella trichopoda]ERN11260.1 hypothetical protein AMTR_s00024p00234750 [Amborella trichopoda]|eukprot:XP_006849679.1 uncharacterized protein LOC18439452 [Amborella trichopoda]